MKLMLRLSIKAFTIFEKLKFVRSIIQKKIFAECGQNIFIGDHCDFIYNHVHIGNNVFIGEKASIIASIANIVVTKSVPN